jgi:hypothetical protein
VRATRVVYVDVSAILAPVWVQAGRSWYLVSARLLNDWIQSRRKQNQLRRRYYEDW